MHCAESADQTPISDGVLTDTSSALYVTPLICCTMQGSKKTPFDFLSSDYKSKLDRLEQYSAHKYTEKITYIHIYDI